MIRKKLFAGKNCRKAPGHEGLLFADSWRKKMKTRKLSSVLIAVLSVLLVFTMMPLAGAPAYGADDAAGADGDAPLLMSAPKLPGQAGAEDQNTEKDSVKDLLKPGVPEGYSDEDNSNPYGYEKGVPFRLYEDAEVYSFITDPYVGEDPMSSIYELYKKTDGSSFLDKKSWEKVNDIDYSGEDTYSADVKKHWFIDTVPLDIGCNDSPRKTCIGFIGAKQKKLNSSDFNVDIWVYDTMSKKFSNVITIGEIRNIAAARDRDDPETMLYQMKHFLSITAGDYDNDSKDTIVAYGAFSDGPKLTEISVTGDGSTAPSISKNAGSNAMLHKKYLDNFSTFSSDTSADGKKRLGCSLTTGDVTGDKIDDLTAVSYTQNISDGLAQSLGDEIVMPYLAVSKGGEGKTGETLLSGDQGLSIYAGTETRDSVEMPDSTERLTVFAPTVTAADTDVTDGNGIVLGGYAEAIYRFKDPKEINQVARNRKAVALFAYSCDGKSLSLKTNGKEELAEALKPVSGGADLHLTPPKVPVAAVSLDGTAEKDRIFAGGSFYELTKSGINNVYTVPCLNEKYTAGDFGWDNLQAVYLDTAATASLNKVGGNYESISFALVGVTKQTAQYVGSPYAYTFRIGAAGPAVDQATSRVTGHYGTTKDKLQKLTSTEGDILNYCKFYLDSSAIETISFVLCPVDYVDDGMTVRYYGKNYTYADPKVLAVLQASPYFGQIGQHSGSTEYEFSNEFAYSDEKSGTKSYGIGFAGEIATPAVDASLRIGYSKETRTWREEEFTNEVTVSFEADHDSVLVYRTPIIYYMYDVWDPDSETWSEQGLSVTYVKPAEYQQLSVKEYNDFAEKYNAEGKQRFTDRGLDPDKFTTLELLGDDKYLDIEGAPTRYYQESGDAPEGYARIDDNVHALGYNGGSDSTEMITGHTVTTGKETNEGLTIDFEIMGGGEFVKGGIFGSFEDLTGHAVSNANTESTGIRTTVANIDEGELLAEGYTDKQIRAHSFSWLPAKWDSGLVYQYKDEGGTVKLTRTVPVYGYMLSDVHQPFDLSEAEVSLDPVSFDYDGEAKTPAVTVKIGSTVLLEQDYSVSYTAGGKAVDKCVEPDTYLAVVKGAGANIGQASAPFSIIDTRKTDISDAEMTLDAEEFRYDGTAKSPEVTVKLGSDTLTKGKDYDIEYAQVGGFVDECVAPGTYMIIAEGKGDYTGAVGKEFIIAEPDEPISIQDAEVALSSAEFTYSGKIQKPSIVTIGGMKLRRGKDYSAAWSDSSSVNAGEYTITIKGRGKYTGTTKATYRIDPKEVSLSVPKKAFIYNGKTQTFTTGNEYYTASGNKAAAAGTYTAVFRLKDKANLIWFDGTISDQKVKWVIAKAANTMNVKGRTASVKYKALKKKAQKLGVSKVLRFVKKGQGAKTYTLSKAMKAGKSFKKYFSIAKKTGKVTVKKGLKKGTYKVTVKVKAAGSKNYKAKTSTVTFSIRVR